MLSSAKRYLEESAKSVSNNADQVISQTKEIIKIVKVYEECHNCNAQISILENLTSQNKCRMCCKLFCNTCITKSSIDIPNHLLDISYQTKASGVVDRQLLCKNHCLPIAINMCMQAFCKDMNIKFEDYLNKFLNNDDKQQFFFLLPKERPEDTSYRKAIRMAHIAGVVADMSGYSFTYKAVKYAYYSSELINILTEGGMMAILNPLLESLKSYGITGPTALMRLYYLGCLHTLQRKVDTSSRSVKYEPSQPGVLYSQCPYPVLEYIKEHLSAAQWMYVSNLPPPHEDNEWGSWYLSQIIRRQGWTLIMCINESTRIPNGAKCPAFALVSRNYRHRKSSKAKAASTGSEERGVGDDNDVDYEMVKEAMLVIRGSKSTMDWSVNLEDSMQEYTYTHIVVDRNVDCNNNSSDGGDSSSSSYSNGLVTRTMSGNVHQGIYNSAMGMLEGYNLRKYLLRLLSQGYTVKVVGHSLGAGVAAMIAAEMRSALIANHLSIFHHDPEELLKNSRRCSQSGGTSSDDNNGVSSDGCEGDGPYTSNCFDTSRCDDIDQNNNNNSTSNLTGNKNNCANIASGTTVPAYLPSKVKAVSAIIFSCPACVTPNIADAFLEDQLLINTVYDYDIIPRFSFKTLNLLAEELKDPGFIARADSWTIQDRNHFGEYAVSMGKAGDIVQPTTVAVASVSTSSSTTVATATTTAAAPDQIITATEISPPGLNNTTQIVQPNSSSDGNYKSIPIKPPKPVKTLRYASNESVNSCDSFVTAVPSACDSLGSSGHDNNLQEQQQQEEEQEYVSDIHCDNNNTIADSATASNEVTKNASSTTGAANSSIAHSPAPRTSSSSSSMFTSSKSSFSVLQSLATTAIRKGVKVAASATAAATTTTQTTATSATAISAKSNISSNDATVTASAAFATSVTATSDQQQQQKDKIYTVTPGPIVQLYVENNGTVHSAVVTYAHTSFERMKIFPAHLLDDHLMPQTREALRSTLNMSDIQRIYNNNINNNRDTTHDSRSSSGRNVKITVEEQQRISKYFNIPTGRDCVASSCSAASAILAGVEQPSAENLTDDNIATNSNIGNNNKDNAGNVVLGKRGFQSISSKESRYDLQHNSSSSSNKNNNNSDGSDNNISNDNKADNNNSSSSGISNNNSSAMSSNWAACSVCGIDVTWPYVLHSDASRAMVAHNCRACGSVVCSLCSPSGESLPGDGINQSYPLPDFRVTLPGLGHFSPQRVCLFCYFDS